MKIKSEVIEVLSKCMIVDNTLELVGEVDRKLYLDTTKVLKNIGIVWDKKLKTHICTKDIDLKESIDNLVDTGVYVDLKKELQFFPTPDKVRKLMYSYLNLHTGSYILEPSAGTGNLISNLLNLNLVVDCVEIHNENIKELEILKQYEEERGTNKINIFQADFLDDIPYLRDYYDIVIMNPSFSKNQDIKHITKALKFIEGGGELVAIASYGSVNNTQKTNKEFIKLLESYNAEIVELNEKEFKESGTNVNTIMIYINK